MKRTPRCWLILLLALLALVLAPFVLYLLASSWLESAGGRQALERELAQRAGMPVRLLGEFDITLFPTLGVGGTELVVGGPAVGGEMVRSSKYAVAVALRPLLKRELLVESIRLAGVTLWLDRLPSAARQPGGEPDEPLRLPAIDELEISQLTIVYSAEEGDAFQVDELTVRGFAEGRDAAIHVKAAALGQIDGRLRWESGPSQLNLEGQWSGVLPGDLQFDIQADLGDSAGHVNARWPAKPASGADVLSLATDVVVRHAAVGLEGLEASAGAQSVRGSGCVLMGAPAALRLDLEADELDLDSLPGLPPGLTESGESGAVSNSLRIDARLTVGLLRAAGVVAHQAELSLGGEPDCSILD